jgi:hypothetical protein
MATKGTTSTTGTTDGPVAYKQQGHWLPAMNGRRWTQSELIGTEGTSSVVVVKAGLPPRHQVMRWQVSLIMYETYV